MAFDRTNPADLAALKAEVNTDPDALGYDQSVTQDGVLDIINLARTAYTQQKEKVSAAAIRSGTSYDGYDGLAIDEQEWLRWMTGSNGFEEENMPVTADLRARLTGDGGTSIWAPADRTAMEAAMVAVFDRDGSRAEDLFGIGTTISRDDWIAARDS